MKIAIYGDSYGNHWIDNLPNDTANRGSCWIELLSENHQVTNFSQGASSLFFSYQHFIKNHHNYDYNIFLVTQLNRLIVPRNYHGEVYQYVVPEKYKDEMDSKYHRDDAFLENQEHDTIFHYLMVDNILRLNPNTLLIPTFPSSLDNVTGCSLFDIYIRSLNKIPMSEQLFKNYFPFNKTIKDDVGEFVFEDYTKCHLHNNNHVILYNHIVDAIDNKQNILNININDFETPNEPFEYYFIKRYRNTFKGEKPQDRRMTRLDLYKYIHTILTAYE
jgi:hypothetical protein